MSKELDLSFLTPDEIEHLESVLKRAKKVEENDEEKKKKDTEYKAFYDTKHFQQKPRQDESTDQKLHCTACDALSAALQGRMKLEESKKDSDEDYHSNFKEESSSIQRKSVGDSNNEELASSSGISTPIRFYREESNFSESTSSSSSSSPIRIKPDKHGPVLIYTPPSRDNIFQNKTSPSSSIDRRRYSEAGILSNSYDTKSMISRSTLPSRDYVGTIDISLTYFPPSAVKQIIFPSKGTRFPENKHLDVLTRKHYAVSSGAKIPISKTRKSGARADVDGELHLFIVGANDLNLPRGSRSGEKTYVKCYLLPDRYHGSKMRSEIHKDTLCPRFEHKFVFRGFSVEEFNSRSIEIVIGGITSAHGRHLVVGGLRLSNGIQNSPNPVAWKDPNSDESELWNKAFQQPSVEVSSSIILRPRIKLTYK